MHVSLLLLQSFCDPSRLINQQGVPLFFCADRHIKKWYQITNKPTNQPKQLDITSFGIFCAKKIGFGFKIQNFSAISFNRGIPIRSMFVVPAPKSHTRRSRGGKKMNPSPEACCMIEG